MSDHIAFEIQSEIMKRLPVKSLIQFRSVCKSWKSLIDSSDFISRYSGQQQHLLVRYEDAVNHEDQYVLVVDDDTFPLQKVSVTIPPSVEDMFMYSRTIVSSHGLLCFLCCGKTGRAVIWNPSIRKAVVVNVPYMEDDYDDMYRTVLGFGVCRETNDPKIVKITQAKSDLDMESVAGIPWQVEVFTLSARVWRSLYSSDLPCKSVKFDDYAMVVTHGVCYWLARGSRSYNLIISFDMTSEEFGEVNLPESLARPGRSFFMNKLRESLVVLEPCVGDFNVVYQVWIMEDGVSKSFKKLYTISGHSPNVFIVCVRGFRKTGEPLIEAPANPFYTSMLAAYEPYSKSITNVGFNARLYSYFVHSYYMETLLLL